MKIDVLTAAKIWTVVFWVVTPCNLVGGYQRFGGTYRAHLQGICTFSNLWKQVVIVSVYKNGNGSSVSNYIPRALF
jgi:hypothetical protein